MLVNGIFGVIIQVETLHNFQNESFDDFFKCFGPNFYILPEKQVLHRFSVWAWRCNRIPYTLTQKTKLSYWLTVCSNQPCLLLWFREGTYCCHCILGIMSASVGKFSTVWEILVAVYCEWVGCKLGVGRGGGKGGGWGLSMYTLKVN